MNQAKEQEHPTREIAAMDRQAGLVSEWAAFDDLSNGDLRIRKLGFRTVKLPKMPQERLKPKAALNVEWEGARPYSFPKRASRALGYASNLM